MRQAIFVVALLLVHVGVRAELPSRLDEAIRAIYERNEFAAESFGSAAWLDAGRRYTALTRGTPRDLMAYDTETGTADVLVAAKALVPSGTTTPLTVNGYTWSGDGAKLLVFTNTRRVWRQNTRGDYWVLDVRTGGLKKLGGSGSESSLMFAKFSPDGSQVAYVRSQNVYVEDLASGAIVALTKDGGGDLVNGTSDWVNEEELDLRDCFRWSPDGRRIAYWQFDTSRVERFTLINNTDSLYPTIIQFPYPKAGTTNSAVRIGVVPTKGGTTTWIKTPGDPRNHYIAEMDWVDERTLMLQHLNRLQNTNDLLLADAATGDTRRAHRDRSSTWLDVSERVTWINGAREFTWVSEKDGWRHAYAITRGGERERLLTRFEGDLTSVNAVDAAGGRLYFTASPENATERYLYMSNLSGDGSVARVTPIDQRGWHGYDISPGGRWALHVWSSFDVPPRTEIVGLPEHQTVRTLIDNAVLAKKVGPLVEQPVEFVKVDVGDGVVLDGYLLKPRTFNAAHKYPVLVYVYGETANTTVNNQWGSNTLFQRALADEGYVVVSFDNRGTPAPKGTAWRKVVYGTVGDLSSKDQAAAIRTLVAQRPYLDGTRIAIYGISGGGSNTLNAMFRFPDIYKVGISIAPVPDQRLYDTIYQERYMGLPEENKTGYFVGSPINFAEGLRGRLLVAHGTGDDNVHYQGTERLVNRLIELGKTFDVMVYPNRTHSLSEGPGTTLHLQRLIARYLLDHLPPER
jgi:dipeptidyl-peptidase 4